MKGFVFRIKLGKTDEVNHIYFLSDNVTTARKRFREHMAKHFKSGEWCLLGVYREVS